VAESVVALTGVGHRYKAVLALEDVSLALASGTLTGLIGPDGVGKSTLLSLMAGAKRLQTGHITVLGADMARARDRSAVCPRIAFMPQGLGKNLSADLSVDENVRFFWRLFGNAPGGASARIDALLQATGLAPFRDRLARNLSGGMRQKLGLCCALVHDPALLILDEPTTGVDPLSRRQFWTLIDRMRAANPELTVVVATAYMEEAESFDRLIAMNAGRVIADATAGALMAQTGTDTLEQAFIDLLPGGRTHKPPHIPPRVADDGEPAVKATGLVRRFGSFTAVDHVDFEIARGEIFGFVGSNGCGKTTTMKMLTGLLPPTEGEAWVFGQKVEGTDRALRRRVGYMSQSFSLWSELTVRQNLLLHARLYGVPPELVTPRIAYLVERCGLGPYMATEAGALPLGIRQRLSLAVAIVHEPELLILDEPTSGVDPLARDSFWALLGELSREQGVTIFVSTHFMNEAARCDRVALMHAGRVLAIGTPAELVASRTAANLEAAFIAYLREVEPEPPAATDGLAAKPAPPGAPLLRSLRRIMAYAVRETRELSRDRVRLTFALAGTAILMLVLGFGINTDVDHVGFAAWDRDRTPESRNYIDELRSSKWFEEHRPVNGEAEAERRMQTGELKVVIEIPPGFGRDLRAGRKPEVAAVLNGALPFHAETALGYVQGTHAMFLRDLSLLDGLPQPVAANIETRFRYNQDFLSARAMVPGTIALLLALIPAILMALAVVREKEIGTIVNLYVTPVRRIEFILGKQLPYVVIGSLGFVSLALMAQPVFDVPLTGDPVTLAIGAVIYVSATTAFGLLISCFASTQIAALFGTMILTFLPAMNFSGMLTPVSALSGMPWLMGHAFPMTYFLPIAIGAFSKALGFAELQTFLWQLAIFPPVLIGLSLLLLRKQER